MAVVGKHQMKSMQTLGVQGLLKGRMRMGQNKGPFPLSDRDREMFL